MNVYGWTLARNTVDWYRTREPLRSLALRGHDTRLGDVVTNEEVEWADVIHMSVNGQENASAGWQRIARLPNHPTLVYDIDDDVWNFDERLAQYQYWKDEATLLRVQEDIAVADVVTTPSKILAEHLTELNPNVVVIPNTVPEYLTKLMPMHPTTFTVGYQGGDTHTYDMRMVAQELLAFMAAHSDAHMHVWGAPSYVGPFADRVHVTPWESSIKRYYLSLLMSVGIAPLVRNPFNDAKSGIKALEYAALGIPAVVSAGPTYDGWVIDGSTGYQVEPGNWADVLDYLTANPVRVQIMGENARRLAMDWTTEMNGWRWEAAYMGEADTVGGTVPASR